MYQKQSGFIPNDPANSNYLRNPNGTMPFPRPSSMPVAFWDGGVASLLPVNPVNPKNYREARWRSPLFDLRPDLRNMTGGDSKGVPIWGTGRLYCLINGLRSTNNALQGLEVSVTEFASPNRPDLIFQVTDKVVVSDSFTVLDPDSAGQPQKQATTLEFYPLNGSSPIRFWQIEILFEWTETLATLPRFSLFSAYY